jgi:hypothetical protein
MRLHRVIAIAMSLGLMMCSSGSSNDAEDANIGSPCVPSNEEDPNFTGFRVTEETIETGTSRCGTGVCLVNHFQGRVSCPLGQPKPAACSGPTDTSCGFGAVCVEAAKLSPGCDPDAADEGASQCAGFGSVCNVKTRMCQCTLSQDCPSGSFCDPDSGACSAYVCHKPGQCQESGADEADNEDKACCVPGTETPVTSAVCGQCAPDSNRNAEKAVYCSCRCGPAEGAPEDDDAEFCDCPAGFACEEIRPYLGVGDPKLTGKYCIKQGSEFQTEQKCGQVVGYYDSAMCKGIGVGN